MNFCCSKIPLLHNLAMYYNKMINDKCVNHVEHEEWLFEEGT